MPHAADNTDSRASAQQTTVLIPVQAPLDPNKTAPFALGPRDAPTAVLVLHGFTGSPWEVRPLGEALAARGFRAVGPRLPGHGTTPEAMLFSGRREWERTATDAFTELTSKHRTVCIAGFSMGALLAIGLAARFPAQVRGLALLAPALRVQSRGAKVVALLGRRAWRGASARWIEKKSTDLEDDAVRAESPILPRYPMARLLDFLDLQRDTEPLLARVQCPSLVVAAVREHVVDFASVERLHRALPSSRLVVAQRGFHILPRDVDRALVCHEVCDFVDTVATSSVKFRQR